MATVRAGETLSRALSPAQLPTATHPTPQQPTPEDPEPPGHCKQHGPFHMFKISTYLRERQRASNHVGARERKRARVPPVHWFVPQKHNSQDGAGQSRKHHPGLPMAGKDPLLQPPLPPPRAHARRKLDQQRRLRWSRGGAGVLVPPHRCRCISGAVPGRDVPKASTTHACWAPDPLPISTASAWAGCRPKPTQSLPGQAE